MEFPLKSFLPIYLAKFLSSFAFAVLMSSLAITLAHNFHFTERRASELTGLFLALNYILPLIGGYFGNHIVSFKKLYCVGYAICGAGYFLLSVMHAGLLDVALALVLMGSTVNTVSLLAFINDLIDRYKVLRRKATWIYYAAMNAGFLFGCVISGALIQYHQIKPLFLLMGLMPILAALLVLTKVKYQPKQLQYKNKFGLSVFIALFVIVYCLLHYSLASRFLLLALPLLGLAYLIYSSVAKRSAFNGQEKQKLKKLIIFMLLSIFFWSIYMLMPTVLMLFISDTVHSSVGGVKLAPQWFESIDSLTLVSLTSVVVALFAYLKNRYQFVPTSSMVFALGFLFLGLAAYLMSTASHQLAIMSPAVLLGLYIFLQSTAELFIGPEGYTLPGKFAPEKIRGIATGAWVSTLGIACLCSTFLADTFFPKKQHMHFSDLQAPFHVIFILVVLVAFATFFTPKLKAMLNSRVHIGL